MQLIRYRDHLEMPWKNGGGLTREIAREQDDAKPYWRLSLATVGKNGPFSVLLGCQRIILLLDGQPMTLHFDDGELVPLVRGKPLRFSCERPLEAILPSEGERKDLNMIWREADLVASVQIMKLNGRLDIRSCVSYRTIIFVAGGTVAARLDDGEVQKLAAGDALVLSGRDFESRPMLSFRTSEAELILFALDRRN